CRRKVDAALSAQLAGYETVSDDVSAVPDRAYVKLGNAWSRAMFDGAFHRTASRRHADVPSLSLVFVQSRDGNTVACNPSTLGGGPTDKHVMYEGLSRVDADAVLSGA